MEANRIVRSARAAAAAPAIAGAASSSTTRRRARATRGRARGRDDTPRREGTRQPVAPPTGPVSVESGVSVRDFSQALGVTMQNIIKSLMGLGVMKTATQSLTDEEVELIAAELEREVTIKHAADEDEEPEAFDDTEESLVSAAAGRHDHGPRRPRQDDAARRDPEREGRRDRGGRDHAAHRRVPGRRRRPEGHLPRHAGPRGLHRDARPRRQGHRHRRARRRRRRLGHAADARVDLARARGGRADRRRGQQGRPAGRKFRSRARGSLRRRPAARGVGRHDAGRARLRQAADRPRRPAREDPARRGSRARPEGEPECRGVGPDHRVAPRHRPRARGDDARPPRHAEGRRRGRRRRRLGQGAGAPQLQGREADVARPGDPVEILGFDKPPPAGELARVVENERAARDLAQKRAERLRREQLASQRPSRRLAREPVRRSSSRARCATSTSSSRATSRARSRRS